MKYQQNISACFSSVIGEKGLSKEIFEKYLEKARNALESMKLDIDAGKLAAFDLSKNETTLDQSKSVASEFCEKCDLVFVLGTGGASLSGQALSSLSKYNGSPQIQFIDNIDPLTIDKCLSQNRTKRIGLLIISKSGKTLETLVQAITFVTKLGTHDNSTTFIITEKGDTPLNRFALGRDISVLEHDPKIGGRFSAFSIVGLIPALTAGVDAESICLGASETLKNALETDSTGEVPAVLGAAVSIALYREKSINISVLMPYSDQLNKFTLWYRQLWAESLGKRGVGITPVPAMGSLDQHSQLQLYLDGPRDKMISIISPNYFGVGPGIDPMLSNQTGVEFLADCTVGDVISAEQKITTETIISKGIPVRTFEIDSVDESTVGALMMHYMLETVIAARLLDVNPFNQPAVEEGKDLVRKYLRGLK